MKSDGLQATDAGQRARSLDTGSSFIIQAPAGSGKTELLSMRFLKLLSMVDDPSKVLAVTFTRKATREMLDRIMLRIHQAEAGTRPSKPHELQAYEFALEVCAQSNRHGWELGKNPGLLQILTIDGLSSRLAGMGRPDSIRLRVTEYARPLYLEAAQRLIDDVSNESEDSPQRTALETFLYRKRGSQGQVQELLADQLERRDQWLSGISSDAASSATVLEKRQQLELAYLVGVLGSDNIAALSYLLTQMSSLADVPSPHDLESWGSSAGAEESLLSLYQLLNCVTTKGFKFNAHSTIKTGVFKSQNPERDEFAGQLNELIDRWRASDTAVAATARFLAKPPVSDAAHGADLIEAMRVLLVVGYAHLRVLFSEQGVCDFQHIAELALQSLGDDLSPGEALLIEDGRLEHILVDEFQDTSQAQFQLLTRLTAGWQPDDGRTLFLVGDPMQSIYRFRKAEVGLFQRVYETELLGSVSVHSLVLSSNFRSCSEVIDFVNAQCSRFFSVPSKVSTGAVGYTSVDAEIGEGGCVQLHPSLKSADLTVQPDAIASLVADALQRDPEVKVGVLAQKRSQLQPVAEALGRAGINYEAVGVQALSHRPSVQDLLILTRALLHPADRIAWLGTLSGPWCALSPKELEEVAGDTREVDILEQITQESFLSGFDQAVRQRLEHTADVLVSAVALAPVLPLSRRVEIAWVRLTGPLAAANNWDLANAQTFIDLVARVEKEDPADFLDMLELRLEKLFAQTAPSTVQLMTIHKAKGLEFDVVVLPGLDAAMQGDRGALFRQKEFHFDDGTYGAVTAPADAAGSTRHSIYRYLGNLDAEEIRCEAQRLLYVALTRARRELHLFGQWAWVGGKGKSRPGATSNTFMSLLWAPFHERILQLGQADDGRPETQDLVQQEGPFPLMELCDLPKPSIEAIGLQLHQADAPNTPPDRDALALGDAFHLWLELINNHPDSFNTEPTFNDELVRRTAALESSLIHSGARSENVADLRERLVGLLLQAVEDDQKFAQPLGHDSSWAEVKFCRREGDALQTRIVDRLMLDDCGQFVIVDYKTGRPSPITEEKWGEQLGIYRDIVESATGLSVKQSSIYSPGEPDLLTFDKKPDD